MYSALMAVQSKTTLVAPLSISFSENIDNEMAAEESIRYYASQRYDLIIIHGSQFKEAVERVSHDYPMTSFAWGSCFSPPTAQQSNIFTYHTKAEEGGYLNGIVAALATESNILGIIGHIDSTEFRAYKMGFEQGAYNVSPEIAVLVHYTQTFYDKTTARHAAQVLVSLGADVLTGTGQQSTEALEVAKDEDIFWVGMQYNQNDLAKEHVIVSQRYNWENMIISMINYRKNGIIGGKTFTSTLKNGGIQMVFNREIQQHLHLEEVLSLVACALTEETILPLRECEKTLYNRKALCTENF